MTWAGFGSGGRTSLAIVDGRMNAVGYQQLLENHLLPHGARIGGNDWIFQQDNARIHTARSTLKLFCRK